MMFVGAAQHSRSPIGAPRRSQGYHVPRNRGSVLARLAAIEVSNLRGVEPEAKDVLAALRLSEALCVHPQFIAAGAFDFECDAQFIE